MLCKLRSEQNYSTCSEAVPGSYLGDRRDVYVCMCKFNDLQPCVDNVNEDLNSARWKWSTVVKLKFQKWCNQELQNLRTCLAGDILYTPLTSAPFIKNFVRNYTQAQERVFRVCIRYLHRLKRRNVAGELLSTDHGFRLQDFFTLHLGDVAMSQWQTFEISW